MCSVGDDTDETGEAKFMPIKQSINLLESKCNKCRDQTPCILLRGKDVYCKNCFITGTVHKFKSLLGKHRLISPNDRVLVHHEPGHAGAALLHFLRSGLNLNTPKKLRFTPVFLFIDRFFNLKNEERKKLKESVLQQLKSYNFVVYFASFSAFINNRQKISELLTLDPNDCNDEEKVLNELNLKASETSRNEVLSILQNELLVAASKELDCKFVFTPQLSVDIASDMLTNVSLGRGLHIPFDTGFCDARDPDVRVLRPLRIFEAKELAFYNVYNGVETVNVPHLEENAFSSVQNLMKKFVMDLQLNFPATIATVVRTGDKLTVHQDVLANPRCRLCKVPVEIQTKEVTARSATEISRWISTQNTVNYEHRSYEQFLSDVQNGENQQYCYSCSKVVEFIKV